MPVDELRITGIVDDGGRDLLPFAQPDQRSRNSAIVSNRLERAPVPEIDGDWRDTERDIRL